MIIEELKKEIEVSRNLLDTLPQNNIKNKKKYNETLEESINKYEGFLSEIEIEIKKRINKYMKIPDEITNTKLHDEIEYIRKNIYLLNPYNSSYEKLNLDKILYELNHFYKEDLEKVNENIIACLALFEEANIQITPKDFFYSEYAYKYIEALLNKENDDNVIKETFENLYWQCSDIIKHLALNIKHLYYKNQNIFEKHVQSLKNDFIKSYKCNILDTYSELVVERDLEISQALKPGLNRFLNKELNINDYHLSKMELSYQIFTDDYKDNFEIVNDEINKLMTSCEEYKQYIKYNYIIEDIKDLYKNKDQYKNVLKSKLKMISKKEKALLVLNKKKKKEKIDTKIINLIKELEILYKELDDDIFNDKIYKHLTDDSSIYESLCLACSHYSYLVKCIKKTDKEILFSKERDELTEYLLSPYNNIIDNIAITEEKDLPLMISDRFKLSNFKITKESISSTDNLEEIIETAKKIEIYNNIVLKLQYDNIKFLVDTKDIN